MSEYKKRKKNMIKSDLILKIAVRKQISAEKAKKAVDLILETITDKLEKNGRVEVRNFGAFSLKFYDGMRHNPKTKEKFFRKLINVRFRAGKELKERVNDENRKHRLG